MEVAADYGQHDILKKMEELNLIFTNTTDPLASLRHRIIEKLSTTPKIGTRAEHQEEKRQHTLGLGLFRSRQTLTTPTQLILLVRYVSTAQSIQSHLEKAHREAITAIPQEKNYADCLEECSKIGCSCPASNDTNENTSLTTQKIHQK